MGITNYVSDITGWKIWMQEYKHGVILIYPPEPHKSKITELRNRYTWSQSSECDAHITSSTGVYD